MQSRCCERSRNGKKLIEGGDLYANVAYFCFLKLGMRPREFVEMDIWEKIAVIAFVLKHAQTEAEKERKLEERRAR